MLTQGFRNVTEAPDAIFQQNGGGGCRQAHPGELGCFHLKQEKVQNLLDGPRFENCYLHPHFDKFIPVFVFFGCFLSETSRNFTDSTAMGFKHSEAIKNGPRTKLGYDNYQIKM